MPNGESGNNNIVAIVAIIVIAALAVAFFVYALPMLQPEEKPSEGGSVEINIPTPVQEEPSEPAPSY